ncbi:hypothetical protein C1893_11065 [Pseudomonas sp. MPR-ANC1]|nr:hypothetical protein C1893_11065 [Pseudomonas sp. MPR-ANC1]
MLGFQQYCVIWRDRGAFIAGKPAPTGFGVVDKFCDQHKSLWEGSPTLTERLLGFQQYCVIWRDRGAFIAGKPAPTGFGVVDKFCDQHKSLWELACQRWGQNKQ